MVQGNCIKKNVCNVITKTIYIGEIVVPPGKYKGNLKKEENQEPFTEINDILIGKTYINDSKEEKESYHNIAVEDVYA